MTQFVEQLRNQAKWYAQPGHNARDLMDSRLLEKAADEIERLTAKLEAMEKQEPVAWVRKLGLDLPSVVCVTDLTYRPSDTPKSSYIPLYLAPGAKGE